jgi:hypothetical protein
VRFVAAAHSQRELEAQVVDYIRERCDYVLWPRVAANVRELIARDRKDAAIAAYFANVGQRWDPERLELLEGDVFRADFAVVDDHADEQARPRVSKDKQVYRIGYHATVIVENENEEALGAARIIDALREALTTVQQAEIRSRRSATTSSIQTRPQ